MNPPLAKTQFLKRLEAARKSLDDLTPAVGVEAMLAYFEEERADGCQLDQDGDMLLFQWGTYDWGQGLAFEVSIVRQLIATDDEEEEPQQLDLRFRFEPRPALQRAKGICGANHRTGSPSSGDLLSGRQHSWPSAT